MKFSHQHFMRSLRMRWLESITNSMDMNLGKLREMVKDRNGAWHLPYPGRRSWAAAAGCHVKVSGGAHLAEEEGLGPDARS